ncbi:hypothetical protein [Ruminococcus sp. Marseille-P6503]|uniref:hypothetical protein n=1 Tax=Ruminococcus sp. Marseille-P6503 TaxID=2364796 RepID=UPI000F5319A0|nr:hypothetical protein [Ruminococcus sp. Marseille-P6503]
MTELEDIVEKFINSGWELISEPSQDWLDGKITSGELIKAVRIADKECGSCGCEFDPLYKRAVELLSIYG